MKGNLVDRYVMEVGRRLPEKQRADVQLELRSSLQDALEARGLDADSPKDEDQIVELLREFGKPSHVAEGYGARLHLIGPELQPLYWWILRLNVLVITVVHLARLVFAAVSQSDFGAALGSTVGQLINSVLVSFAILTIVFAVLERFLPGLKLPAEEWDPRNLPEITPDREKIDYFELIFEVIFTGAFITVINVMPNWQFPADLSIASELIAKFQPFFPWITALAMTQIALNIYLLTQGRWQPATRWVSFAHAAASVALIAATLTLAPYSAVELVNSIVQLSVAIAIIIALIDAAVKLYRALRPGVPLPWETWRLEQDIEDFAAKGEAFGQAVSDRMKQKRK